MMMPLISGIPSLLNVNFANWFRLRFAEALVTVRLKFPELTSSKTANILATRRV